MTAERDVNAASAASSGPFAGVRVLEVSVSRPGRIAGMLLADLGADVVRAVTPETPVRGSGDADEVGWDRGKRVIRLDAPALAELVPEADVLIVDHTGTRLRSHGLDASTAASGNPGLVHVWMPPYAPHGEWSELPEDPLLLAAVGGIAGRYPAVEDRPVAPVAPTTTYIHGAMGSAAAAAGLLGRRRHGAGQAVVVSGLHAAAAQMTTMMVEGLDQQVFSPGRSVKSLPFWRMYQGADERWFFLATLTPDLFFRALDALDRMDIMLLPEVEGEFSNIIISQSGGDAVARELEAFFAARPCRHWLDLFAEAGVPCAPVQTSAEWLDSDIVAENDGTVERPHSELGTIVMPGVPVSLSGNPGTVGELPVVEDLPRGGAEALWRTPHGVTPVTSEAAPRLPLAGIRVIDAASFLAAPFVASVLADFGAEVVKVEPVAGDAYRAFQLSFLAANQRKRALALDVGRPEGRDLLLSLVRGADVLVENLRPGKLERLGLAPERLRHEQPRLVHCSVSAYGHAGRHAQSPGFDPVFQALSGMAAAQGSDGEPVAVPMPAHDTCTGVLGALGVLAALHVREESGRGQRVWASLASSSTFLQSAEFTVYDGRPAPARGGTDFPGPHAWHRYYECSDGWVAVAAEGPGEIGALLTALQVHEPARIEEALRRYTVKEAVDLLAGHGVPACRVVESSGALSDRFLEENDFSHVVVDRRFGRLRMVARYADWGTTEGLPESRSFDPGEDTRRILAGAGYDDPHIEELLKNRLIGEPDLT